MQSELDALGGRTGFFLLFSRMAMGEGWMRVDDDGTQNEDELCCNLRL